MRHIDYKIKAGDKLKMSEKFHSKTNIFFRTFGSWIMPNKESTKYNINNKLKWHIIEPGIMRNTCTKQVPKKIDAG